MTVRLLLAAMALSAFAGIPAVAAGPSSSDVELFGKDPGKERALACFTRRYDAAHLKAHPRQNVTAMTLLVNSYIEESLDDRLYNLEIGVSFRSVKQRFQVTGGCDRPGDPSAPLSCGIDCDGGLIGVKVNGSRSVLVAIPYGARTWNPDDPDAGDAAPAGSFGKDDKVFRLDRTSLGDCLPLVTDDDLKAALAAAPAAQ
jgi:hypothetical protein